MNFKLMKPADSVDENGGVLPPIVIYEGQCKPEYSPLFGQWVCGEISYSDPEKKWQLVEEPTAIAASRIRTISQIAFETRWPIAAMVAFEKVETITAPEVRIAVSTLRRSDVVHLDDQFVKDGVNACLAYLVGTKVIAEKDVDAVRDKVLADG